MIGIALHVTNLVRFWSVASVGESIIQNALQKNKMARHSSAVCVKYGYFLLYHIYKKSIDIS